MADGFIPLPRDDRADGFAPTFLIAALDAARREAAGAPPPLPQPDPVDALIEAARTAGFAAGRAEALRATAQDRDALALHAAATAADALRAARGDAASVLEDAATGLARVALSVLDAALPGIAAAQAPALAADFARRLAPMLRVEPEARLVVAPGLAAGTAALLPTEGISVTEDAALPPGDARAEWRAGGAALDLAARRREIRRLLHAAGLAEEDA